MARPHPEPGAPAASGVVPLSVPHLTGNEAAYVQEALATNWVSSAGPFVDRFEREVAAVCGVRHAVAVASGTAALHLALLVVGVRPGDEVVVSALSFVAPANAVRYAGAVPVFADVDPGTWQLDVRLVESFLRERCERRDGDVVDTATGRRVGALLPVHALGHPVDLAPLAALARELGVPLVEDAAEALGAQYRAPDGGWTSPGSWGTMGCLSFNGNKVITSGGGGMLLTDDDDLAVRARYLSTQAKDDPVAYVHGAVGYNYRLGNVQAAIGCGQLEQLDAAVAAKRRIAARYREAFADVAGMIAQAEAPWARSSWWLSTFLVEDPFPVDRDELLRRLGAAGVQSRPLWQPLHQSPAHAGAEVLGGDVAARLGATGLSLPSSVGLTEAEQERVIDAVAGLHA